MAQITEADVRKYVEDATSADDIQRAIAVAEHLHRGELPECHAFNAALIAVAITQAKQGSQSTSSGETETADTADTADTDRQLLHRALQRSLRLPH